MSSRGRALLIVALLVVLPGAAEGPSDPARARLGALSPAQREALAASLREFDLRIGPAEQEALRDLDRKLTALPVEERLRYLDVLRRFHNWLSTLPESTRDSLLAKAPDQRMAEIRSLTARYPVPTQRTPLPLRLGDLTGPSTFELASLFRVWRQLSPEERKEVEALPLPRRLPRLHALGRERQVPRESRPDDFDAAEWMDKAEAKLPELRLTGPELKAAAAAASSESPPDGVPLRKGQLKELGRPLLYRYAVNLYTIERTPKPVSPDNLAKFLGELPSWVRAAFNDDGDDWARRKLSVAYRLAFPKGEYQPVATRPAASGAGRTPAPPPPPAPPAAKSKSAPPPPASSSTPF